MLYMDRVGGVPVDGLMDIDPIGDGVVPFGEAPALVPGVRIFIEIRVASGFTLVYPSTY